MRWATLLLLVLACDSHTAVDARPDEAGKSASPAATGDIAYYTCPMHPSVHQPGPGHCPICGMALTPVLTSTLKTGAVQIDAGRRSRFGIAVQPAARRSMGATLELPAVLAWDSSRVADVTLKVSGWVESEAVPAPGVAVKAGQVLFSLYSPELVAGQDDLLRAAAGDRGGETGAAERAIAARKRLTRWGMTNKQIDDVLARGQAQERMPVQAPISGYVLDKTALVGAMVSPGQTVYRLGDTSQLWLEASVPEATLPQIREGMDAIVHVPGVDEPLKSTISLVYPTIDPATRTGKVRVALANPDGSLRPDQWATLEVQLGVADRLAVPASAVIYTGPRRVVFVDTGGDRLEPRDVTLGVQADGYVEIRDGLHEGDLVVTSGNYLVAADSRLASGEEAAPAASP